MKVYSNNITSGHLDLQVGKFGVQMVKSKVPTRSFHIAWEDLPEKTKSLALTFVDHDAIPVCGFSWIHWTVANINPADGSLPENASEELDLLEGINSWASPLLPSITKLLDEEATAYGGCAPPDRPHLYTIEVYALDTLLNLKPGFYMSDLYHAMHGHMLAKVRLEAVYKDQ